MADTVSVDYLYPPNMLDGSWDEKSGNKHVVVRLLGLSDGTGESNVTKVRLSDLKTQNGAKPTRVAVEFIEWQAYGMSILLEWDRAPRALIARLNSAATQSAGELDWRKIGGMIDPGDDDRTGDILLSSSQADSGDTYDITLHLRLKD